MRYKGHDFQVGEVVRFRQWDDMKAEFSTMNDGYIYIPGRPGFISDMNHLCGTEAIIKGFINDPALWDDIGDVRLYGFESRGETNWYYSVKMLEPVEAEYNFDEGDFLSLL